MAKLKKGDKIQCFWLPHPRNRWKDQQWTDGEVLDRKGNRVKMSAKVHWGKYHHFWTEVGKIRAFMENKYT